MKKHTQKVFVLLNAYTEGVIQNAKNTVNIIFFYSKNDKSSKLWKITCLKH